MSDVVSGGLFLFLYYLSLCVMSGAETVLVEMGGSAPFWDEELPHGTGRPYIPDSGGATQLAGWAVPHLIYQLAWRLACACIRPDRCH